MDVFRPFRILALLSTVGPQAIFGLTPILTPSINSPGAVGQTITWVASSDSENPGHLRYRFTIRRVDSDRLDVLKDFGPDSYLHWMPAEREGDYVVDLTVRDVRTGEVAATGTVFQVHPRIRGIEPQVNATEHPLVFLFSTPPCREGSRVRVEFSAPSLTGSAIATPYKACDGESTVNFLLAGMRPETRYAAHAVIDNGAVRTSGPTLEYETGAAPFLAETMSVIQAPSGSPAQRAILTSNGFATDMEGVPIWSSNAPVTILTRPESGGYFWGMYEDPYYPIEYQSIRKFDLAGMVLRETNAEQVNLQLTAMGRRPISSFHHEVRPLPDGRVVVLAAVEQILTDVQGPGDVNVIGDMIIVFDDNLNVLWTWDTFDWLDVRQPAILGETCAVGTGGCPPFYLSEIANDWTHGNAIQLTPDGSFLYSARHLDWLIKINYANGDGDGHVMWRLGKNGDFTFLSNDPWPWFSHQHDGAILDGADASELIVFDNGNTRWRETGQLYSRGQALLLDEVNHTATLKLNSNLGVFAPAVGSAQKLLNGNYHFDAGFVIQPDNSLAAFSLEVDSTGRLVYGLRTEGFVYRSFRMEDLYTAP